MILSLGLHPLAQQGFMVRNDGMCECRRIVVRALRRRDGVASPERCERDSIPQKAGNMSSRKDRMAIHNWNGVTVLDLGEMDIWDGADLSLLREMLAEVIEDRRARRVGVNLRWVKYIPSGFFGMLSDWHDKGVEMYVYEPQENVARMLWFRKFFDEVADGCFRLLSNQKEFEEDLVLQAQGEWGNGTEWNEADFE